MKRKEKKRKEKKKKETKRKEKKKREKKRKKNHRFWKQSFVCNALLSKLFEKKKGKLSLSAPPGINAVIERINNVASRVNETVMMIG